MAITPWSRRIRALQKAGFSLREIGDEIGLTIGAVGDLAVGRNEEPRASAAFKLHELHLKYCSRLNRPLKPDGTNRRSRPGAQGRAGAGIPDERLD